MKGVKIRTLEKFKLIDTAPEELTADNLIETSASEPVPGDEEEDVEEIVPENKLI